MRYLIGYRLGSFSLKVILLYTCTILIVCCRESTRSDLNDPEIKKEAAEINTGAKHFIHDYPSTFGDGDINVVIEIPAGTLEKYEVNKNSGNLQLEVVNANPRIIDYLGYPGNYGMIPRTLLPKELGGDGDPLDVIVLGPPAERASLLKCKLIGVLYLLDGGEQDDKLIAISKESSLYDVDSLQGLNSAYPGILEIIRTWFTHYKGVGKMESKGFGDLQEAQTILNLAIDAYKPIVVN